MIGLDWKSKLKKRLRWLTRLFLFSALLSFFVFSGFCVAKVQRIWGPDREGEKAAASKPELSESGEGGAAGASVLLNSRLHPDRLFCIQTFNAYGPSYAPFLSRRTRALAEKLSELPPCEFVHFQEVWTEEHHGELKAELLRSLGNAGHLDGSGVREVLSPNLQMRVGLMSFFSIKSDVNYLKLFSKNRDGVLDEVRRVFGVKKGFHVSRVEVPSFGDVLLVNLHLHPSSQAIRVSQLLELFWFLLNDEIRGGKRHQGVIVSGDFNFVPGSLEYELIDKVFLWKDAYYHARGAYFEEDCTYCAANPLSWLPDNRVFDYVFWGETGGRKTLYPYDVAINLNEMPGGLPYSDHFGLRVEFKRGQVAGDGVLGNVGEVGGSTGSRAQGADLKDQALGVIWKAKELFIAKRRQAWGGGFSSEPKADYRVEHKRLLELEQMWERRSHPFW